ncbi:Oplophorus-luciferin 2-monooxygenase non-catalytic subunit [Chionoecetes opilio]|uniref:Oplophorus-luciferin 2-monooxygenase non-catalytic subunit n=1 Tax=Chionoecetes opilio TaxID=41210 RepID=A0A8J5D0A3_CHIOP|nr:Oplophorus-luciferin 2-monooxygenase non-catalytic subunit [Chionoecetes opilio]
MVGTGLKSAPALTGAWRAARRRLTCQTLVSKASSGASSRILGQLHELDLSNNDLKELEEAAIVTAKPSLTYLDVSRNEISSISHDSIVGLATQSYSGDGENKITQFTQKSWQHIFDQLQQPYGIINLAENPLVCGCDMAWIVLNKTYLALFTDTTTCASGERVIFLDPNIFTLMCPHV